MEISKKLREAKKLLSKNKTYENALKVQKLERELHNWRKENFKIINGDLSATENESDSDEC